LFDFSIFAEAHTWIALFTLIILEVVLGIDNVIFISIVTSKLPKNKQQKTRNLGLLLALFMRIGLLFGITFIITLKEPVFYLDGLGLKHDFSWRDIILVIGGFFLVSKSTSELHHKVTETKHQNSPSNELKGGIFKVFLQIILLDIVFSFDSILTAIGLVDQIILMIIAVIVAVVIMIIFTGAISEFIEKKPTLQILALSFLILIGVMLIADGFGQHVPKGYIYFSVAFALIVELMNLRIRGKKSS
jgi:predicted tellurium resistance membrane protein TerC